MELVPTEQRLHKELFNLVLYVERLRQELAETMRKEGDRTNFENITAQLDALVKNTETASNDILSSSEGILDLADKLREDNSGVERNKLCDQLAAHATNTLQACGFQDITGQRVTKILHYLNCVEARVSTMAKLYGEEAFESMTMESSAKSRANQAEVNEEEVAMDGPAMAGEESISQDEIDALFD